MSLIPSAVICAATVFLLLAGENVACWIRTRRARRSA